MEVNPVKEAKPPKYPRRDEVSPESIKGAVPRRWTENRSAKAALAVLTISALAGCAPEAKTEGLSLAACNGNIEISVDGQELVAATPLLSAGHTGQVTALPEPVLLPGVLMQPAIPVWPFFVAAGCAAGAAIWAHHKIRKRKRAAAAAGEIQPAKSETEPEEEADGRKRNS